MSENPGYCVPRGAGDTIFCIRPGRNLLYALFPAPGGPAEREGGDHTRFPVFLHRRLRRFLHVGHFPAFSLNLAETAGFCAEN